MDILDFRPVSNTQARVTKSAANPAKDSVEFIVELGAGELGAPAHFHPNQEEIYEVMEGEVDFMLGTEWRTYTKGQRIVIPKNKPHSFKNNSTATVVLHNIHSPGLSFEEMMRGLHSLVASGKVTSFNDLTSLIYISMLWVKHKEVQRPVSPPWVAMKALAAIGKLRGFKL